MNNLIISFEGEMLKRWKETTSTGKELVYIAVKVPRDNWTDIFKIKARDVESVKPYATGTKVLVEAFVVGREWTNPQTNKTAYFTDLTLAHIASAATNVPAEVGPSEGDLDDIPF